MSVVALTKRRALGVDIPPSAVRVNGAGCLSEAVSLAACAHSRGLQAERDSPLCTFEVESESVSHVGQRQVVVDYRNEDCSSPEALTFTPF